MHFIPTYSSWLNQVERFFALITDKAIRRGSFTSVKQLVQRIDQFVTHHNASCQPFQWTATADSILEKLHRLFAHVSAGQDTSPMRGTAMGATSEICPHFREVAPRSENCPLPAAVAADHVFSAYREWRLGVQMNPGGCYAGGVLGEAIQQRAAQHPHTGSRLGMGKEDGLQVDLVDAVRGSAVGHQVSGPSTAV